MLSNSAPIHAMSSVPIKRAAALLRPDVPRTAIDRQGRVGHGGYRNEREGSVSPRNRAATGTFHPMVELRPDKPLGSREASKSRISSESPDQRPAAPTCVSGELDARGEPLLQLVIEERESLNRLYNIVSQVGCDVVLYDGEGGAISRYGKPPRGDHRSSLLELRLGGVASHDTAISVDAMSTVGAPNAGLDCWAAPIFDAQGDLIGYLEASPADRDMTDGALALTRAAVTAAARAIEERSFRNRYRRESIIALIPGELVGCGMLLAVDRRQCVVGADRHARAMLARHSVALEDTPSLWTLFEKSPVLSRSADMGDVRTALVPIGSAEIWSALVTPASGAAPERNPEHGVLHCRPRLDSIGYFHESTSPAPSHGGLAPRVLQRVRAYIDAHLGENIELAALADTAGLSRCHFARAFKQSVGCAPHYYLMQRRLEQAKKLIVETEFPLAQIALECGFSDQSHFSRRFLQYVGATPRSFRWSAR